MQANINVLFELERIGWDSEFAGDDEIKCKCPFHQDKTPSCSINIEKQVFKCHACNANGDFITFLAKSLKTTRALVFAELSQRYNLDTHTKIIEGALIEKYHSEIWTAKPLLNQLYARGITNELIKKYRLGFLNGRITIPITNENGMFVNVRNYSPGAPGGDKFRNKRGHGKPNRLFPCEQLKFDTIMICGGELKAIIAAELLNPLKIGAITTTGGEQFWDIEFSKLLVDKKVYVCYDIDKAGQKAAETRCAQLKQVTSFIGNVILPLSIDKYPHGDINDWVGQEGATLRHFDKLLQETKEWESKTIIGESNEEPINLSLSDAINADKTGKRIKFNATVSAMDTSPYIIPSSIFVRCDKSQDCCSLCPILPILEDKDGNIKIDISPESPSLLEMVAATKASQRDAIIDGLGIPHCKVVEFEPVEYFTVESIRVSPQLEITNDSVEKVMQPMICVGSTLEPNESYSFTGRMFPHPKTQVSTLLISQFTPTQDTLNTYKPENLDALKIFQPREWTYTELKAQLDNIYEDLETNVTNIYRRRDLHLCVDLTYHSCLFMRFDNKIIKGWVETLILGDSSQGKSETTLQLQKHYRLGEKVECKNATTAGLLGGLQQFEGKWFVTWGIIPTQDQRLVILEELKGASKEIIGSLTDMRSSGIAEIPKIEKRRTHARTRLIAISNPRSDRSLSSHNFGLDAIKDLIGGLEDIRRFDFCLLVSNTEITTDELNLLQREKKKVNHRFTSDLCRDLILWTWTRKEHEISFSTDAMEAILESASQLCKDFVEDIPIIDRGSMRYKLARLCIALAARTFSINDDGFLYVRKCHVEFITKYISRIYSSSIFGYDSFSKAIQAANTLIDAEKIKKNILQTPFPKDFIEQILYTDQIVMQDICDWCGWDRVDASQFISFLVRKHALKRLSRVYCKAPPFIQLLKDMLADEKLPDRPDFIEEKF